MQLRERAVEPIKNDVDTCTMYMHTCSTMSCVSFF